MAETNSRYYQATEPSYSVHEEEDPLVPVVRALISGDSAQWQRLMAEIHKLALSVCANRQAKRGVDFANDVALRCMDRIHRDNYRALRSFLDHRESYPELQFETWVRGIIHNSLIDEIRSLPTIARKRSAGGRELSARLHVVYEDGEHSPPKHQEASVQLDLRRILRWIRDTGFPSEQRQILMHWLHGHSIEECSQLLQLDIAEARRLLRAGRRRLRRKFEEKL